MIFIRALAVIQKIFFSSSYSIVSGYESQCINYIDNGIKLLVSDDDDDDGDVFYVHLLGSLN